MCCAFWHDDGVMITSDIPETNSLEKICANSTIKYVKLQKLIEIYEQPLYAFTMSTPFILFFLILFANQTTCLSVNSSGYNQ